MAVAEVTIDGEPVRLGNDGSFSTSFYVPRNGKTVEIVALIKKVIKLLNHCSLNVVRYSKPLDLSLLL